MDDRLAPFDGDLASGEGGIDLAGCLLQPGAQMRHKPRSIHRKRQHLPVVVHGFGVLLPRNALRPGIGVEIAAFNVEVARFEVPEDLGEDADLKQLAFDLLWGGSPFALAADHPPPDVRHPGEVEQGDEARRLLGLAFLSADGQPVPSPMLIGEQEGNGFLQPNILMRGMQGDGVQKLEERGAMRAVEGGQEGIIGVAH